MRTLLQNGWLYDGTGAPARRGSLLIDGETIAAVDAPEGAQADLVLDCEGLAVAPGFIDSHSHNDWFACRPDPLPYFAPFLEQGIATQVAGQRRLFALRLGGGHAAPRAHRQRSVFPPARRAGRARPARVRLGMRAAAGEPAAALRAHVGAHQPGGV